MIKFIKCTAAQYAAATKNADYFYYVDSADLYLGTVKLSDGTELAAAITRIAANEDDIKAINSELDTLKGSGNGSIAKMIEDAKATVVNTLAAADASVTVGGTATARTVGVKLSAASGNALELADDGLKVTVPAATDYTVTVTESAPEGYAKAYTIAQSATGLSATINIPKDMVVSSGEVVTNPEGQPEGTYLVLTLANATSDKVYINVSDLIEYVTAGDPTDTITVSISSDHKVTASVRDGSIGTTQLAASVVTSLNKANSALQSSDIVSGTTDGTISVKGTEVSVAGLDSAAYAKTSDFDAAGSATTAETNAKAYADSLASNYDAKGAADTALTSAKTYADSLASNYDAKGAADTALTSAKAYTDSALTWEVME